MTQGPTEYTDFPPPLQVGGPVRVLLVDDDLDFLETTAAALVEEGLSVMTASTARDALERASLEPPDVILLDILLPGADGIDVLEALRSDPATRSVPVLACTALGRRDSGKLLPTLGFDGLLAKPLDPHTLARAIREHAQNRS